MRRPYMIAWRAMRSPVKCGSRMLAAPGIILLARRQRHIGIRGRQHIIHDQEVLAAAADGKRVDRRDPRLLGGRTRDLVRWAIGPREPTQHFVFEAENVLDVEQIGNLAAIEPCQVDA